MAIIYIYIYREREREMSPPKWGRGSGNYDVFHMFLNLSQLFDPAS